MLSRMTSAALRTVRQGIHLKGEKVGTIRVPASGLPMSRVVKEVSHFELHQRVSVGELVTFDAKCHDNGQGCEDSSDSQGRY